MHKSFIKKLIFSIALVMAFLLPAIGSYVLAQRSDAADEKAEAMISSDGVAYSAQENDLLSGTQTDSEEMAKADDNVKSFMEPTTEMRLEPATAAKQVTDTTNLTAAEELATASDADAVPDYSDVPLNGRKVYLTFDDGPSDYTNELLDILARYDVKATFFVVVEDDEKKQELNRILDEGHTLGLHSESHVYSKLYADYDSYVADVQGVHDWVQKLTGYDSKFYRFPGGSSNMVSNVPISECVEFLHSNGYEFYDWNSESRDAENLYLTPDQLNNNVMNYVRSSTGNVTVLMHDLDEHYNTIEALPALIETLKSEGYELCKIDETTPPVQHYMAEEE